MNFPQVKLSHFHSDVLKNTQLGQLCGKNQLFRGRYEVLRMIGRGGFGVTFLAKDTSLPGQPFCVIKQLCPKFSDPKALHNARQRFEREAKILNKLGTHPQIPMLLDYFVDHGEFYLVQEYIRGITLARLVRRSGCLSPAAVQGFLRDILPLLQYVHDHGVIHRDIKPQNIILSNDDGRLVLIDFGAVKELIAQASDNSVKNSTTHFIGTVGFAPPEQFSLRPVYSSDLYSLGVTCLYLLTGKAPLQFQSDRQTGELRWRKALDLSDYFANILNRMLAISLKDRYSNARALLRALENKSLQENLAKFLVIQPQANQHQRQAKQNTGKIQKYTPPTEKTAIEIRKWKQRMQARQRHKDINRVEHLFNH
ncbi:MAG: serine/threonine protein kinase [Moorea sp. SIO3C2]|nr:serine/threonine protein kinase [Moorena sp. SIO3C2]